jgi:hypothetical protein
MPLSGELLTSALETLEQALIAQFSVEPKFIHTLKYSINV